MLRRDFLKALPVLPALAEVPRLRGAKLKIRDLRPLRTRMVRETGTIVNWVGIPNVQRVGGTSFIEVHTDQGLVGLGPAVTEGEVAGLKNLLVGRDPFDIERLAAQLRGGLGGGGQGNGVFTGRGGASAEIAALGLDRQDNEPATL